MIPTKLSLKKTENGIKTIHKIGIEMTGELIVCTHVHQLPAGNNTLLNCTWCIWLKIKSISKQRKITIFN